VLKIGWRTLNGVGRLRDVREQVNKGGTKRKVFSRADSADIARLAAIPYKRPTTVINGTA
jgi:hypothetical protein